LMYRIMPKQSHWVDAKHLVFINQDTATSPAVALEQAYNELRRMGAMALINLEMAIEYFLTDNEDKRAGVYEGESSLNYLNRQITSMLMEIENIESAADMRRLSTLLYIAADFERIGAHAENIVDYDTRTKKKRKPRLSAVAMEELSVMGNHVTTMLAKTLEAFDARSDEKFDEILAIEDIVNNLDKQYNENHIKRLKQEKSDPKGGVAFVGIVSDLERCADHAKNIVHYFKK